MIEPEVGGYLMSDFLEGADVVRRGEEAAEAAMPAVRAALEDAARTPIARWWRRMTVADAAS